MQLCGKRFVMLEQNGDSLGGFVKQIHNIALFNPPARAILDYVNLLDTVHLHTDVAAGS